MSAPRVLRKNTTLFENFNKEIYAKKFLKNQNKFQKNEENSEINIFKNMTPFLLKFSPLDHKFLHL